MYYCFLALVLAAEVCAVDRLHNVEPQQLGTMMHTSDRSGTLHLTNDTILYELKYQQHCFTTVALALNH